MTNETFKPIGDVISGLMAGIKAPAETPSQEAYQAFARALEEGRLSDEPGARTYAGHYMYMGKTGDGQHDAFKNRWTREYLPVSAPR